MVRAELEDERLHLIADPNADPKLPPLADLYSSNDFAMLHQMEPGKGPLLSSIRSIDDLLERDKIREEDGSRARSRSANWLSRDAEPKRRSLWCRLRWRRSLSTITASSSRMKAAAGVVAMVMVKRAR